MPHGHFLIRQHCSHLIPVIIIKRGNILHFCFMRKARSSLVAQRIKDLALSLHWLGSLLWLGLDPWPGKFHMPRAWQKERKEGRNSTPSSQIRQMAIESQRCDFYMSVFIRLYTLNIFQHLQFCVPHQGCQGLK